MVGYQRGGPTRTGSADNFTNTNVTVGSTSTTVLARNELRKSFTVVNDSDETVYISIKTAGALYDGIPIRAYGGSLSDEGPEMTIEAIYGICASGGKRVCVTEGY